MLPLMASSMSASVGELFRASSEAADIICPDWQYPHCGTSCAIHAACTALPILCWPTPSIVVILRPLALATASTHERVATPSTCTVHAPQAAIPQPYLVPVMSS